MTATRCRFARALNGIAAAANASISAAVASDRPGRIAAMATRPGPAPDVEHAPTANHLRVCFEVTRDGEPARPRERPVRQRSVLVVGLDLGRMPERQHFVGQMEAKVFEAGDRPKSGMTKDEGTC